MSNLIKTYTIPPKLVKGGTYYVDLELYDNCIVGTYRTGKKQQIFFKDYMTIEWTQASFASQYAQLIFINHENANNYISANNLKCMTDPNRMLFESGMFSYAPANDYVENLHREVLEVFNKYKSSADQSTVVVETNQTSTAEEIKQYKELLDMGIITQEEFDQKKKQLLGL